MRNSGKETAMKKRWMVVGLFGAGVVTGGAIAEWQLEYIVSAQARWQCRQWTVEASQGVDAVAPWLGTAERVEISTAGLAVANRYVLVACKQ
jgi:hypothetical protein